MKRMLLKVTWCLSRHSLLLICFFSPFSSAQKLAFFVGVPQSPPVIYKDETTGRFKGIVPDILNSMPAEDRVRIDYIQHNRSRGEEALYNNEVDATILTKEWASNPEKLLFTLPIYQHRDFIYGSQPTNSALQLEETLSGKNVCTRRGYIYPRLQGFFSQGIINRVNTSSEETELRMVLLNRCHFAVVNEFIAEWLINNNNWQDKIYQLQQPLNSIDFTMAFSPSWQKFVDKLNQHIQQITQNGQLEEIIQRNRKQQTRGN
jgi:ABC-type amino acid transport substrate-binding protein